MTVAELLTGTSANTGFEQRIQQGLGIQSVMRLIHHALFAPEHDPNDSITNMTKQIGQWEGVPALTGSKSRKAFQENAAELYLRLSRSLEDRKASEVSTMATALGVLSFQKAPKGAKVQWQTRTLSSGGRKGSVHAIALFLTWPCVSSLLFVRCENTKQTMSLYCAMKHELVPWVLEARHPMILGALLMRFPRLLNDYDQVKKGNKVQVRFEEGMFYATVQNVKKLRAGVTHKLLIRYEDGSEETVNYPEKDVLVAGDKVPPPPKKPKKDAIEYAPFKKVPPAQVDAQLEGWLGSLPNMPSGKAYPRGVRIVLDAEPTWDLYRTCNNDFPKQIAKKLGEAVGYAKEIVELNKPRYAGLGQSSKLQRDTVLYIPKSTKAGGPAAGDHAAQGNGTVMRSNDAMGSYSEEEPTEESSFKRAKTCDLEQGFSALLQQTPTLMI